MERLIPGGRLVQLTRTATAQIPGGGYVNDTTSAGGGASYSVTVDARADGSSFADVGFLRSRMLAVDTLTATATHEDVLIDYGSNTILAVDAVAAPATFADVATMRGLVLPFNAYTASAPFAAVFTLRGRGVQVDTLVEAAALANVTLTYTQTLGVMVDSLAEAAFFNTVAFRHARQLAVEPVAAPATFEDVAVSFLDLPEAYVLPVLSFGAVGFFQPVTITYSGALPVTGPESGIGFRYTPDPPPMVTSTEELLKWTLQELQKASTIINNLAEGRVAPLSKPPAKLFDGMIRMADGTNWNPGSGRGYYGYDAKTGTWKFFG